MLNVCNDGFTLVGVVFKSEYRVVEILKGLVDFGAEVGEVSWGVILMDRGIRGVIWNKDGMVRLKEALLSADKVGGEAGVKSVR